MVITCIIAFVLMVFFIWLLRSWALKLGLVDQPGGRKQHQQVVPLIGGAAIFLSFYITLWIFTPRGEEFYSFFTGGCIILVIGLLDDFLELHSHTRLIGEIVAVWVLFAFGKMQVSLLGNLFFLGNISLGWLALPFTILVGVGFLNAMNMIDGQDGLAGGVGLGQVVLLAWLSWYNHNVNDFVQLMILCSILVVFLFFNMRTIWRKHAVIFLGDAGSTLIATLIAWYAIRLGESGGLIKPVIILWILAFPIFDFFQVSLIRIKQGKSLLKPSLDHCHHLLHFAGINTAVSSWILTAISFSLGLAGVVMYYLEIPEGWQLISWLTILSLFLGATQLIRRMTEYRYAPSK